MQRSTSCSHCHDNQVTMQYAVMVSVTVSKLGCTELIFVDPGVKVDGNTYHRDVLLSQQMLPSIRQIAGDLFVFQQDSAQAHHAHATVKYLCQVTPEFMSPTSDHLTALT